MEETEKAFIDYLKEFGRASHMHMHINVVDFVKRPLNRYPKGLFTKDDGSVMTNKEAKDALIEELLKGHRVIPCGKCDNFDYSGRGCGGHPVEEEE
jgi:hypothetical protein